MSIYAIGDLQGCLTPLLRLLDTIQFDPNKDQLWFTGDLVNRGPQSLATLEFIHGLGKNARAVLGNHDLHLLAAAAGFGRQHSNDTIDEILHSPRADELIAWVRTLPLAYTSPTLPGVLMVHAGVLPAWSVAQTLTLADEVSAVLRSDQWQRFMSTLYGNKPTRWDDSLTGDERLRVIVNALTRMRFCNADGSMDLKVKESVDRAPDGLYPWFDAPNRRNTDHRIIMGHWSTLGLKIRPDLIAIDTGCIWGGCLTALRLDDDALFHVDCERAQDPMLF